MMLSSKRLWCALLIAVMLVGGLLFEPVQKFAKWSAIEYASGGSMSAANVHFHRQQEVLELDDLHTSQTDDASQVHLTAERALVKLDMPTLLDKRLLSPRVKLQGVRIELASLPINQPASTATVSWQQKLDEVLTAFRWDSLREDCEALLKSDNVLNEFDERMRSWLLRSQQIMFHGDQLSRTIQGYSNPLRHQNDIRNQLAQLEQLRSEQEVIQKQFNGINAILAGQVKSIQSLSDSDVQSFRLKCERKAMSLRTLTAEQTVIEWAKELIVKQVRLGHSVALLLPSESRTNPYNVDVRPSSTRTAAISISGIEADGILTDSLNSIPFTAAGEYSTVQRADYMLDRQTAWEFDLNSRAVDTHLALASGEGNSKWRLKSTSSESIADTGSAPMLSTDGNPNTDFTLTMLEMDASLSGREITGKARMNIGRYSAFIKLPCKCNADLSIENQSLSKIAGASPENWIEFNVVGSITDPSISLAGSLPAEFTNELTKGIQQRLEAERIDTEAKLKTALDAKIEALTKQVELAAKDGLQAIGKQRETLTAMYQELEQSLQSREGFEYARLPTKPNATR